ncbi:hypothetical protein [Bacillus sp. JJ1764]
MKESKERIHAALRSFGYILNSTTLFA